MKSYLIDERAEQAVLGYMIEAPTHALKLFHARTGSADWFTGAYHTIALAIEDCAQQGHVDQITVAKHLPAGTSHLDQLIDDCVLHASSAYGYMRHLDILRHKFVLRQLEGLLTSYQSILPDHNDARELVNDLRHDLGRLIRTDPATNISAADHATQLLSRYEQAAKGNRFHLPTAFKNIERFTLGNPIGKTTVVGARPGVGKSLFALTDVIHMASPPYNLPGVIFTLEMTQDELIERGACQLGHLDAMLLRSGQAHETARRTFKVAAEQFNSLPIYIIEDCRTLAKTLNRLRDLVYDAKIKWAVVDYLQLMSLGKRAKPSRREDIGTISNELTAAAKEFKIHNTIVSQLKRTGDTTARNTQEPKPRLADLKESGDIEQDAYQVILLHPKNETEDTTLLDVTIAKCRGGTKGSTTLWHHTKKMIISDKAQL